MQFLINQYNCLDDYIKTINNYPILTAKKELFLAKQWFYQKNLASAKKLVLSHLKFVVHIARHYSGYSLLQSDLIQEGNIGLMKAVHRFNPDIGVRLVSFAIHWIKAEIHEYVLKNWRIVKVATTKVQRKLFFNLRKTKKRLGWFQQDEINIIAKELKVTNKDIYEMESRMFAQDIVFDLIKDESNENQLTSPILYLKDKSSNFSNNIEKDNWNNFNFNKLNEVLKYLDKRSQDIIKTRWLNNNKITLQKLAKKYKISAERIRQLEKNAIKKIKLLIKI